MWRWDRLSHKGSGSDASDDGIDADKILVDLRDGGSRIRTARVPLSVYFSWLACFISFRFRLPNPCFVYSGPA